MKQPHPSHSFSPTNIPTVFSLEGPGQRSPSFLILGTFPISWYHQYCLYYFFKLTLKFCPRCRVDSRVCRFENEPTWGSGELWLKKIMRHSWGSREMPGEILPSFRALIWWTRGGAFAIHHSFYIWQDI